jgi:TonB C terminal
VTALIMVPFIEAHERTEDATVEQASRGITPERLLVRISSPDMTPSYDLTLVSDDADAPIAELDVDLEHRAAMLGRYLSQIRSRVERAWTRPRSPIIDQGDAIFHCVVDIQQAAGGDVKTVTMKDCNGGAMWQASLANAIQRASPLPAPPDPAVFASTLTLSFDSVTLASSRTEEGFEADVVSKSSMGALR